MVAPSSETEVLVSRFLLSCAQPQSEFCGIWNYFGKEQMFNLVSICAMAYYIHWEIVRHIDRSILGEALFVKLGSIL
jgi:hypothetical protein